jgi:hypothetical protein
LVGLCAIDLDTASQFIFPFEKLCFKSGRRKAPVISHSFLINSLANSKVPPSNLFDFSSQGNCIPVLPQGPFDLGDTEADGLLAFIEQIDTPVLLSNQIDILQNIRSYSSEILIPGWGRQKEDAVLPSQ